MALSAFLLPLGLSLVLCALVRAQALRRGWVDAPGDRKLQPAPVPLGGGVGVALALALGLLVLGARSSSLAAALDLRAASLPWLAGAAGLVLAAGLWDDLKDLGAGAKFGATLLAGALVAAQVPESRITVLGDAPWLQILLTALWIAAITNAFNLLDNMDALCGGVALVASLLLAAFAVGSGRELMASFFLALAGAVAGFLAYNLPPARLYLGDAGSLLAGFLLATGSALLTYDESASSLVPIAAPLLVFAVPVFDTVTVMGIRLREGRPLLKGDRSHFSHRLVALGMTPREAVGVICLLAFATGTGALVLESLSDDGIRLVMAQAVGVFGVILLLERAAGRKP